MNTNNRLSIWNNGLGPLSELRREMDRFFNDAWSTPTNSRSLRIADADWHPACDVEEAEDHYLLALEMPGIPKDQIRLEVIDNQILISGERQFDKKRETDGAWYSERRFGRFHRSFALPAGVSADKVEANYQDGMLSIYVPKAESAKPRQVKITNGSATGFFGKLIGQSSAKDKEERHSSNETKSDRVA